MSTGNIGSELLIFVEKGPFSPGSSFCYGEEKAFLGNLLQNSTNYLLSLCHTHAFTTFSCRFQHQFKGHACGSIERIDGNKSERGGGGCGRGETNRPDGGGGGGGGVGVDGDRKVTGRHDC